MEQAPENEITTTHIENEKEEQIIRQKVKKRKKGKNKKRKERPSEDKRSDE